MKKEELLNELNRMRLALQLILLSTHVDDKPELTKWIDKRKRETVVKTKERDKVEKISEQAYKEIMTLIKKPEIAIDWRILQRIATTFAKSTTEEIAYINKLERIFIKEGMKVVINGRNKN